MGRKNKERMLLLPFGTHETQAGSLRINPLCAETIIRKAETDLPILWGEKRGVLHHLAGLARHETLTLTDKGLTAMVLWSEDARRLLGSTTTAQLNPLLILRNGNVERLCGFRLSSSNG